MFGLSGKWGTRTALGLVLAALALGAAGCARKPQEMRTYDDLRDALGGVRTAAGSSALDRMTACDLRIDWGSSSLLLIPMEATHVNLKAGDRILAVAFSAPNRPGQTAGRSPAEARWLFRDGDISPHNGWANTIQMAKRPMGSEFYLNC